MKLKNQLPQENIKFILQNNTKHLYIQLHHIQPLHTQHQNTKHHTQLLHTQHHHMKHQNTKHHHTQLHHMKLDHNIHQKQTTIKDHTHSLLKLTQWDTLTNHIQLIKFMYLHKNQVTKLNIKLLSIQKNIKLIMIIINN
jgi:hypothetical protein